MQQVSSIRLGRIAGGVAGLVGLAVAELGAGLIARDGSPVSDLAEVVTAVLPAAWISDSTGAFGAGARIALLAAVVVVTLVLAVVSGQLELKRKQLSLAVYLPAGVVTLLAVSTQVGPGALGYVPAVLGLSAGYLTLRLLIAELRRPPGALEPIAAERRNFLKTAGLVALGGIVVAGVGRMLVQASNRVAEVRTKIVLPPAANPAPTVPVGTDLDVAGLTRYITPNASFYRIDTALQLPVIDPETWTLKVTGLVSTPVTLTYAELLARPLTEHLTTLTCMSNQVGGDLAGNAVWLGLPVHQVLAEAGPQAGADMVLSVSQDGWSAATPLSTLTDPDVSALLAVGMNGEPLSPEHGFPVRMVVPGLYGDVSATKWVTELKVTTFDDDSGYWAQKGWSERGPIKIASRIDIPTRSVVEPGTVIVAGVAWAQTTGISKVEVQVDDGPWQDTELADTVGPDTWRQWAYDWTAEPGDYEIRVRATDADGRVQTDKDVPPFPSAASGLHTVPVKVRPA
ncbi:molybdopterin-dependent oxidoreductase [Microlunatus aurantiacus]|uniref:Molybdopterin-dependent oxidoreductase n=1 Tax=Microlunatus aurantiacus TaxID=446786 RepID=A0ABP7DBW5_9ACTN